MCSRISSALGGFALLAACGSPVPSPPGEAIDCALGPGAALAPVCTLEQVGGAFVLHHPDGGFRRVVRDPASGDLAPRDGAEALVPAPEEEETGAVAFAIGPDRYRIPRAMLGQQAR